MLVWEVDDVADGAVVVEDVVGSFDFEGLLFANELLTVEWFLISIEMHWTYKLR